MIFVFQIGGRGLPISKKIELIDSDRIIINPIANAHLGR